MERIFLPPVPRAKVKWKERPWQPNRLKEEHTRGGGGQQEEEEEEKAEEGEEDDDEDKYGE